MDPIIHFSTFSFRHLPSSRFSNSALRNSFFSPCIFPSSVFSCFSIYIFLFDVFLLCLFHQTRGIYLFGSSLTTLLYSGHFWIEIFDTDHGTNVKPQQSIIFTCSMYFIRFPPPNWLAYGSMAKCMSGNGTTCCHNQRCGI